MIDPESPIIDYYPNDFEVNYPDTRTYSARLVLPQLRKSARGGHMRERYYFLCCDYYEGFHSDGMGVIGTAFDQISTVKVRQAVDRAVPTRGVSRHGTIQVGGVDPRR